MQPVPVPYESDDTVYLPHPFKNTGTGHDRAAALNDISARAEPQRCDPASDREDDGVTGTGSRL